MIQEIYSSGSVPMLSVPFPVITLLALFLLMATVFSGKPCNNGALRFLSACIILVSLNTIRWEYDSHFLRDLQSVMAMLLPAIAWHSFVPLNDNKRKHDLFVMIVPVLVSLAIRLVWAHATDFILSLLFFSYGVGLLKQAFVNEQKLKFNRLNEIPQQASLTFFAGSFLCLSALTDLLIAIDFDISGGKHAALIILITQLLLLPIVGVIIYNFINSHQQFEPDIRQEKDTTDEKAPAADMTELYIVLEKKIHESELYLDPNLTLALLARKTGVPARNFSAAVNSVKQCNVSQWINGFRVERAKELLLSTSLPVTHIMLESGFMTKSNFNREFQRLSGLSPRLFRQQALDNSVQNSEKL